MTSFSISQLSSYYDLLFSPATGDENIKQDKGNIIDILRTIILEQGNMSDDIVKKINSGLSGINELNITSDDLKKKFHETFTIIHNGFTVDGAAPNKNKTLQDIIGKPSDASNTSKLAIIQSHTNLISPATRDINNVILFFNSIPSIELAKSVPILDIKIKTTKASVINGRVQSLSLFRFLDGTDVVNPDGYSSMFSDDPKKFYEAGMELFTSPQTLVNTNFSDPSIEKRAVPIIDLFRPLMSIDSLELKTVSSGQALMCYKNGNLKLTVHDRSRLSEVSEFIKPDMYAGVELSITYGWNHPDDISVGNVYADLINSMKKKEKFRVANSSFAFTDTGEVKIDLSIWSMGAYETSILQIAEGEKFKNSQKKLEELSEAISEYRVASGLVPTNTTKEVRAVQILNTAESYATQLQFDDKINSLIDDVVKKLKAKIDKKDKKANEKSFKDIIDSLEKLFGKPDSQESSLIENTVHKQVDAFINEKIARLEKIHITEDPFVDHKFVLTDIKKDLEKEGVIKQVKSSRQLVSLARLLTIFVGETLSEAATGFDEVQLIFYPANANAGLARGKNLGGFLIELDVFKDLFQKEAYKKGSINFNLQEFLTFVASNFIDDPRSFMYGTRMLYKGRDPKDPTAQLTDAAKKDENIYKTTMQSIMEGVGGTFSPPQVSMYIEAVPPTNLSDGDDKLLEDKRTIVKIHIVDVIASPYQTQKQILSSEVGSRISSIGVNKDDNDDLKSFDRLQQIFTDAVGEGIIKTSSDGTPIAAASGQAVKNFVKRTTPSITYGTNASIIKQAGLATIQDKSLATLHIQKHLNNANALQPAGAGFGGLPMRVLPATMDMIIIGCPLLEFAQQFFVDFNSGTTLDNIYRVVEVSHSFSSGKFETRTRLVPEDSYGSYETLISKAQQMASIMKKN